jgi:S-adenosylmethionine decarboxylase
MMWGQHFIVDMSECDLTAVKDKETILTFCSELVEKIGMVPYGEPLLEHFAKHIPSASGYTLVQLIETSSITAHFAENSGDIYLDVFSCKEFAKERVLELCNDFFSPSVVHSIILERTAGIPHSTIWS